AARLDEPAPVRIVVELDGEALHPNRPGMSFREVVEGGPDPTSPLVRPDADPEPADNSGLVPLDRGSGEAQDLAALEREPRATLRALGLRALTMDEVGRRDEDARLQRPGELGRCLSVCRAERTNLHPAILADDGV